MLKSKEEMSCFAEIVLNGRIPYFIGLYFGAPAPNRCETPLFRAQGIKKRYKIFSCIFLFDCGDRIWTCLAHLEIWSSAFPLCVQSAELSISRLHHLPSSATGSGRCCSPGNPSVAGHKKRYKIFFLYPFFACGDRIWTCDLRVMSPTSYRTALLRGSIKWAEKDSNLRSYRNRFTVCPLWPLGNPPIVV